MALLIGGDMMDMLFAFGDIGGGSGYGAPAASYGAPAPAAGYGAPAPSSGYNAGSVGGGNNFAAGMKHDLLFN